METLMKQTQSRIQSNSNSGLAMTMVLKFQTLDLDRYFHDICVHNKDARKNEVMVLMINAHKSKVLENLEILSISSGWSTWRATSDGGTQFGGRLLSAETKRFFIPDRIMIVHIIP